MPFSNYLREGTSESFTTLGFNRFGSLPEGLRGTVGARGRFLVNLFNIGHGSCFFGFSIQDLHSALRRALFAY